MQWKNLVHCEDSIIFYIVAYLNPASVRKCQLNIDSSCITPAKYKYTSDIKEDDLHRDANELEEDRAVMKTGWWNVKSLL